MIAQMRLVGAREGLDHRRLAAIGKKQMHAVVHMRRIALGAPVDVQHLRLFAVDLELQRLLGERRVEPDDRIVALGERAALDDRGHDALGLVAVEIGDTVGHRNTVRAGDAQRRLAGRLLRSGELRHSAQEHLQVGVVIALDLARRQADRAQPLGGRRCAGSAELFDQLGFGWSDPDWRVDAHAAASSKPEYPFASSSSASSLGPLSATRPSENTCTTSGTIWFNSRW